LLHETSPLLSKNTAPDPENTAPDPVKGNLGSEYNNVVI